MSITLQKTFDKVTSGLLKQGRPSISHQLCRYRAGDKACAIGQLIPDSKYTVKVETTSLNDNGVADPGKTHVKELLSELGYGRQLAFLKILQQCHDRPYTFGHSGKDWLQLAMNNFLRVANKHHLSTTKFRKLCKKHKVKLNG